MNRIDAKFAELREQKQIAFIPFITVGDPSSELSVDIILELERGGADIIELGVPYSDPLADGPVIQASSERALLHSVTILDCIAVAKRARLAGSELPFILFTYFNPVLQIGLERIFKLMNESDIAGVIIPDLPYEEDAEVKTIANKYNIHLIPLVAPTSNSRIAKIVSHASGFIYCVSSLGVTGVRSELHEGIQDFIATVRSHTDLPVAVGFGISSREQVAALSQVSDGVIVGSALVRHIHEQREGLLSSEGKSQSLLQISEFVRQLKNI
ncbi:tryptophan synthase subunit alpha [Paenibacillus albiflavus]|uniref:Tryptophan synthase alpha chain n=1 Tax=Paenibacillus albiflavus TaxID=2545760 RepID=A0A4R4ELQ9_9BACL|nr:tryptophan synthase subunit alpha [Paenibacillus albiflavus]TCZ81204.1 tryptophan synthase subunit alpha [Paenibacillus albiflavus]